jgi:hypothetical protein
MMARNELRITDEEITVRLLSAKAAMDGAQDEIVLTLHYGPKRLQLRIPDPQSYYGNVWQNDGDELEPVGLNLVFGGHYT